MDHKIYIHRQWTNFHTNDLLKLQIHIDYKVQGYIMVKILNNSLKVSDRQIQIKLIYS